MPDNIYSPSIENCINYLFKEKFKNDDPAAARKFLEGKADFWIHLREIAFRAPVAKIYGRYVGELLEKGCNDHKEERSCLKHFIFLDLSGFKKINDTFGHSLGDEVMREYARLLQTMFRNYGKDWLKQLERTCINLSGDEFMAMAFLKQRPCGRIVYEGVIPTSPLPDLNDEFNKIENFLNETRTKAGRKPLLYCLPIAPKDAPGVRVEPRAYISYDGRGPRTNDGWFESPPKATPNKYIRYAAYGVNFQFGRGYSREMADKDYYEKKGKDDVPRNEHRCYFFWGGTDKLNELIDLLTPDYIVPIEENWEKGREISPGQWLPLREFVIFVLPRLDDFKDDIAFENEKTRVLEVIKESWKNECIGLKLPKKIWDAKSDLANRDSAALIAVHVPADYIKSRVFRKNQEWVDGEKIRSHFEEKLLKAARSINENVTLLNLAPE